METTWAIRYMHKWYVRYHEKDWPASLLRCCKIEPWKIKRRTDQLHYWDATKLRNLRNQERDWPSLLRCCKIRQPEKCMRTMKHQKPPNQKVSKTMHTFVNCMKHEETPKWKACKTHHTFVNFIKHDMTPKWKVCKTPHTFAIFMRARSHPEALSSQKWAKC